MAIATRPFTFEDYLALPDDGHSYELLDGAVIRVPSPDNDHGYLIIRLLRWLIRAEEAGFGRVRTAPNVVVLDAALRRVNAPKPDIYFVAKAQAAMLAREYTEGIPDRVIEILSPKTRRRDLPGGKKWDVYQRFAVPRYWIEDPPTRTVAQYA